MMPYRRQVLWLIVRLQYREGEKNIGVMIFFDALGLTLITFWEKHTHEGTFHSDCMTDKQQMSTDIV